MQLYSVGQLFIGRSLRSRKLSLLVQDSGHQLLIRLHFQYSLPLSQDSDSRLIRAQTHYFFGYLAAFLHYDRLQGSAGWL